ncbi:anti-sigma factor family protein [Granulicella tundricola]|uniref:Putative zinc-finger domain-containing protein n=1 Tax=Granulicella tundricola (strain ATCC BAA-1859 / DSM 23138 / MP5ACTX9) TaxID=1198114 RepID=E8X1L6_GRATM|nr:zf-HC2 domain-containing protein [Granulicella tundricola]ADW70251.1 hypothetical protein AciX9_3240 [Granulicella tundricola MP5ACTX9]
MANMIQFDGFDGNKRSGTHCLACEEMLMDAVDGTLNAPDQTWFDRHIASCVTCSEMYADAQRGAAWLEMLKSPRPEPSTDLISRIMAQTSGNPVRVEADSVPEYSGDVWNTGATPFLVPTPIVLPVHTGNLLEFQPRSNNRSAFGRMLLEPRLAMTAAMAFFSIALTLNLMGVRLNELHTADLKPTNLKRSFYVTNAQAVRYFDSLRVVHVMESRVEDLRQQNEEREQMRRESPAAPQNDTQPEQKDEKKQEPGPGTSRREVPLSEKARYVMTNATVPNGKQRLGAFWTGVSASANDKNTDKRTGSWT